MPASNSATASLMHTTLLALGSGDLNNIANIGPAKIDGWIQIMRQAGSPAMDLIANDLVALKGYLNGNDPDQISASLQTLAEHTNALADSATPNVIDHRYPRVESRRNRASQLKPIQA